MATASDPRGGPSQVPAQPPHGPAEPAEPAGLTEPVALAEPAGLTEPVALAEPAGPVDTAAPDPKGPAGHEPYGPYGQPPRPGQPRQPTQRPLAQRPPAQSRQPASSLLQQRAFAALVLAIISLLGIPEVGGDLRRGVVVLAVTVVIGAAGLWLSFTAMSRSRKAGTARPRFAVGASVVGIVGTGLSTLALIGLAAFWPQISQYANCMSGANTVATKSACNQQLNNSLQTSMQLLGR